MQHQLKLPAAGWTGKEHRSESLLGAALAALARRWERYFAARSAALARRELHALSDHRLRDIGLARDQIDTLFR